MGQRGGGREHSVRVLDECGRFLRLGGQRVQLRGSLVGYRTGVLTRGRQSGHGFCRLAFSALHFGTRVQVSQETSVGSQLGATALTQKIYVGFVMMPRVLHEFLHAWEGAAAAGTRTHHEFTWEGLSRGLVVLDVVL